MTLSDVLATRRTSNLDVLRLIAAMAVVVSHAWPLALGVGTAEPLADLTGRSLGGWALALFFFISGFLITQSAERRSAPAFWAARARRIIPGLTVGLLVALALAVLSGATPDARESARYVLRGLSLFGLEHQISGAYATNPYPFAVNGPLWSLQHEVAAYALCYAATRLGLLRPLAGVLALLACSVVLAILTPHLSGKLAAFAPLFLSFALGMSAWRLRDAVVLHPALLILTSGAAFLLRNAPCAEVLATLAFDYAVLLLAFRTPAVRLPGGCVLRHLYLWLACRADPDGPYSGSDPARSVPVKPGRHFSSGIGQLGLG